MSQVGTVKTFHTGVATDIANIYSLKSDVSADNYLIINRKITPNPYTEVLMHFDESPILDECGKVWTAYGSPSLSSEAKFGKSLALNYTDYIQMTTPITLFDWDFTIDGWAYIKSPETIQEEGEIDNYIVPNSQYPFYSVLFSFFQEPAPNVRKNRFQLEINNYTAKFELNRRGDVKQSNQGYVRVPQSTGDYKEIIYNNYNQLADIAPNLTAPLDRWFHFAVVFLYSSCRLLLFIDGVNIGGTSTPNSSIMQLLRTPVQYSYLTIGFEPTIETAGFVGYVDEFRVSYGARWTSSFTPPDMPDAVSRAYIPLTTDASQATKPCLAVRHGSTNYYAIK